MPSYKVQSVPLRLPRSTRLEAIDAANSEAILLNQFITLALVEKLARMQIVNGESDHQVIPA